jgi:hypothetical protein
MAIGLVIFLCSVFGGRWVLARRQANQAFVHANPVLLDAVGRDRPHCRLLINQSGNDDPQSSLVWGS